MWYILLKRYLPAYCWVVVLSVFAYTSLTGLLEGLWPNSLGRLPLIAVVLLGMPAVVYRDLVMIQNEVSRRSSQFKEMQRVGVDSGPGQEFLIKLVAERTGAPEMLVRWLVDRAAGCRGQAEPPA